jgi:hypothetical protein
MHVNYYLCITLEVLSYDLTCTSNRFEAVHSDRGWSAPTGRYHRRSDT